MQIYKPYCYIISILAIPFIFLGVSHYFLDFPSFLASYNYLKKIILNLRFIFHSFVRYYRYF
ncbi:membrane protein [Helicobacter pylori]|nr:membrane protein [Helicobacter pylori]